MWLSVIHRMIPSVLMCNVLTKQLRTCLLQSETEIPHSHLSNSTLLQLWTLCDLLGHLSLGGYLVNLEVNMLAERITWSLGVNSLRWKMFWISFRLSESPSSQFSRMTSRTSYNDSNHWRLAGLPVHPCAVRFNGSTKSIPILSISGNGHNGAFGIHHNWHLRHGAHRLLTLAMDLKNWKATQS